MCVVVLASYLSWVTKQDVQLKGKSRERHDQTEQQARRKARPHRKNTWWTCNGSGSKFTYLKLLK